MPIFRCLALLAAMLCALLSVTTSEAKVMKNETQLDAGQQAIVAIAAFTANGDLDKLKPALNEGLDSGLTVNEIKEILVQLYAYAGFPRSLNGIASFMAVLDERKSRGITDKEGREATPLPSGMDRDAYGARVRADLAGQKEIPQPAAWQKFAPVADDFLKQHLFADIFARDVLTHQQRELATIAALASMKGTSGQLAFHLNAAMNSGLTEAEMRSFIEVLHKKVDESSAQNADAVLAEVLKNRKK